MLLRPNQVRKAFVQRATNARRCRRDAFNKTMGKETGRRRTEERERRSVTDTQKWLVSACEKLGTRPITAQKLRPWGMSVWTFLLIYLNQTSLSVWLLYGTFCVQNFPFSYFLGTGYTLLMDHKQWPFVILAMSKSCDGQQNGPNFPFRSHSGTMS